VLVVWAREFMWLERRFTRLGRVQVDVEEGAACVLWGGFDGDLVPFHLRLNRWRLGGRPTCMRGKIWMPN
jgi:hypothetical protein